MARDGKEMTPSRAWRLRVVGGIACLVLLLDQLSKLAVRASGESLHVTVIPGVLDVTFVRNTGAAFSFGEGHGILFVVLAVAVVAAVVGYLAKSPELSRTEVAGLALVCGGAVGNAIDRLVLGYVTDFIATTFIDFPVFNIADIAITCGVVIAFAGYIFLSPAVQHVDATAELNARDEAHAARRAKKRGERAKKMRERGER